MARLKTPPKPSPTTSRPSFPNRTPCAWRPAHGITISRMKQLGEISLHLVLTIFLAIGMLLFGVLAVLAYSANTTTQANVSQLKATAAAKAVATQKQQDTTANTIANELPYRTYTADPVNGGFTLQIPKDWSLYAASSTTSGITALDIISDPNVINAHLDPTSTNTHEFELKLVNQPVVTVNKTFETNIKNGTVATKAITVSGIAATWFEGAIDTQRHNGIVVTFVDRNQTVVITTDTHNYVNEFNSILSSAKFNP